MKPLFSDLNVTVMSAECDKLILSSVNTTSVHVILSYVGAEHHFKLK